MLMPMQSMVIVGARAWINNYTVVIRGHLVIIKLVKKFCVINYFILRLLNYAISKSALMRQGNHPD
jgi:hypothetical protein